MRGPTAWILLGTFLLSGQLAASQGIRDGEYYRDVLQATDPLYRLDYQEGILRLAALRKSYPQHPGPPLALAVAVWLQELFERQDLDLEEFLSPGYFTRPAKKQVAEAVKERFFDLIAKSEDLSNRMLGANPRDKDARYYLGVAEGLKGAFAFTIERATMNALQHGKKSYEIQKSIVDEDPDYYDSLMSLGTYEYLLDNLPWYVKWVAMVAGYRGDSTLGFNYLIRSAEKGRFVATDARVLLMVLYVREKQYEYALSLAREMHARFPENFIFHLNEGQILERMGRRAEAADVYEQVARRAEKGVRNYQKLPLPTFRYTVGVKLMEAGRPEAALARFRSAIDDEDTPERERALSHLRSGQILDVVRRRNEALAHYRKVINLADVEDSRKRAERYVRRPYRE